MLVVSLNSKFFICIVKTNFLLKIINIDFNYSNELEAISCTTLACSWDKKYKKALENYKAVPLDQHSCFTISPSEKEERLRDVMKEAKQQSKPDNTNSVSQNSKPIKRVGRIVKSANELSVEVKNEILKIFSTVSTSANQIAEKGRHAPLKLQPKTIVSSHEKNIYLQIFQNQDSNLMEMVELSVVNPLEDCCQHALENLTVNGVAVCENTRNWISQWLKERRYRITGSVCYEMFTYTKNRNPDWKSKVDKFIEPKNFKTDATEYGNKFEKQARQVFKSDYPALEVIETGLIVSQVNPWLAVSPDGVVLKDGQLISLLEIKCPMLGKSNSNEAMIQNILKSKSSCLQQIGENTVMKQNYKYYCQVQIGMAILNLESAYFVIHSSSDKKNFTIKVSIDKKFLSSFLTTLKKMYYSVILPEVCHRESSAESIHVNESHFNYRPVNIFEKSKLKETKKVNTVEEQPQPLVIEKQ